MSRTLGSTPSASIIGNMKVLDEIIITVRSKGVLWSGIKVLGYNRGITYPVGLWQRGRDSGGFWKVRLAFDRVE